MFIIICAPVQSDLNKVIRPEKGSVGLLWVKAGGRRPSRTCLAPKLCPSKCRDSESLCRAPSHGVVFSSSRELGSKWGPCSHGLSTSKIYRQESDRQRLFVRVYVDGFTPVMDNDQNGLRGEYYRLSTTYPAMYPGGYQKNRQTALDNK